MTKIDWRDWWRLPEKVRFLTVGAYNTVFGYFVFSLLILSYGKVVNYLVIGFVAHVISVVSAFIVYRGLVFPSRDSWFRSFARFCLSQMIAFSMGIAGLFVLVSLAGIKPLIAQPMVLVVSVTLTYLLHRRFSFRRKSDAG